MIAKNRSLEVRTLTNPESDEYVSLPVNLTAPINGRITTILSFQHPSSERDYIFFTTEAKQYVVISYCPPMSTVTPNGSNSYNIITHASGNLADFGLGIRGNEPEMGPMAALEPNNRCIALHLYEGFVSILPIKKTYTYNEEVMSITSGRNKKSNGHEFIGHPFHCRIEERDVCSLAFLMTKDSSEKYLPQLAFLHQDSRGNQHVVAHSVNLVEKALVLHSAVSPLGVDEGKASIPPLVQDRLKKSRVDGASGIIIPVPPAGWNPDKLSENSTGLPFGGIIVLGEKQITFHDTSKNITHILPIANFITSCYSYVNPPSSGKKSDQDIVRYLLADEEGRMHILAVLRTSNGDVTGLHLDTLGITNICSSLLYLERGFVFVGSQTADSQLIQILDNPVQISGEGDGAQTSLLNGRNLTYINVLDEYMNLGPIVDFDMVPISHGSYGLNSAIDRQCMAVTASGTEKDGSIRFVRNGVGLVEHACVELGGIKGMWNLRKSFADEDDSYLIQSYVGETRILGIEEDESGENIDDEEVSASLAEVSIPDFVVNKSTLFVGNISIESVGDKSLVLQVTDSEIRVLSLQLSKCVFTWQTTDGSLITIASSDETGNLVIATRGGKVIYLHIDSNGIKVVTSKELGKEISCLDLGPFEEHSPSDMEIDKEGQKTRKVQASNMVAIGLWDDCEVQLFSLERIEPLKEILSLDATSKQKDNGDAATGNKIVRSVKLVTLGSESTQLSDMIFIGLGDGNLVSFMLDKDDDGNWNFSSRKDVCVGAREVNLVPFENASSKSGKCLLVTGDRPTVVYVSGSTAGYSKNVRLCYSKIHLSSEDDEYDETGMNQNTGPLVVNFATGFYSSALFGTQDPLIGTNYSLCISDDNCLRLGVIDSMEKIHVQTQKLGMAPRRITYDKMSRLICVGCIDNGSNSSVHESNMGNCIRFFDDSTMEEIDRIDLQPYEMISSMVSTTMRIDENDDDDASKQMESNDSGDNYRSFLILGTAYGYPDEQEPSRGRIIVLQSTTANEKNMFTRRVKQVAETQVRGGVFSICPFYNGSILASINSKTRLCKLIGSPTSDALDIKIVGAGHHGHIMSLVVKSLAQFNENYENPNKEQLAIIGDMMRSISVVKYFPEFQTLEEIARDFNQFWVTSAEMLTDDIYIGAENFNGIFVLKRNPGAASEEVRCRLDVIGMFNLGEMVNKFMKGSLVSGTKSPSPSDQVSTLNGSFTPTTGSETLFGTVDGSLGSVIGLNPVTTTFLAALERAMTKVVVPIGNLQHKEFRSFREQRSNQSARGFVDGDLVESFTDLHPSMMQEVVDVMNKEGKWQYVNGQSDDMDASNTSADLLVDDVLSMVEDMSRMH